MTLHNEVLDRTSTRTRSQRANQPPPPPPESDPGRPGANAETSIERPQTNDAERLPDHLQTGSFPVPVAASGVSGLHEELIS